MYQLVAYYFSHMSVYQVSTARVINHHRFQPNVCGLTKWRRIVTNMWGIGFSNILSFTTTLIIVLVSQVAEMHPFEVTKR